MTEYKEPPDLWQGPMSKGIINMEIFGVACDLDVYDGVEFFHKRHYAPTGTNLPLDGWNSRFNNDEYNAIIDTMYSMNPDDDPAAYTAELIESHGNLVPRAAGDPAVAVDALRSDEYQVLDELAHPGKSVRCSGDVAAQRWIPDRGAPQESQSVIRSITCSC